MTGTITRGRVIRADLAQWDGRTSTYTRPDATGGTTTGLAVGNEVDVLQVFGSGTNRTRASIASATSHINTSNVTLVFAPGTWTIDSNLTIGANFTCHIPAGCVFDVSNGVTLTFSGDVHTEDPEAWYTGSGTVVVSREGSHAGVWHRSAVERAASLTPTNFSYPHGHALRWGVAGDGTSDTTALGNWLLSCSGAAYRAYLPKPSSKYVTGPLTIPDNIHIYCERGVIVEANSSFGATDVLLDFDGASTVTMECNGAIFRMVRADYGSGEHRHIFNLENCTDVLITNPVAMNGGGDGFYMNGFTGLRIHNPHAENNRRNNYSVIGGTNLWITGVASSKDAGLNGTSPQVGLDIEPNADTDELVNINIECFECIDSVSHCLSIFLDDYQTGTPSDVSITIGKVVSRSNGGNAFRVRNVFLDSGSYGGYIHMGEVVSYADAKAAVYVEDKSIDAPLLTIGKVTAVNPCTGSSSFADTGAIYLADTSAAASGGIHIGSCSIKATHTDMDYGVIMEMGAGFTDVRIGPLENVRGYQVTPVRYNNIDATIADATDAIVDTSKLVGTLALTSSTSILATTHIGRLITNTGASANIAHTLDGYPPPGNPYRFRITEAFDVSIDVATPTDRIVGTTGAGAHIVSNDIGEEVELYYVGTIGAVRYWHARILGAAANWSFT